MNHLVWLYRSVGKVFSFLSCSTISDRFASIVQFVYVPYNRGNVDYIIIIIISLMQGIYTYIPETNHVPREYSVSASLSLLFMVPISLVPALALLYFYVSTFRSMCAVPNMAVFCSSFTSCFPGMLLKYFLNDF